MSSNKTDKRHDVMIWSDDQVWLQTWDEMGQMRLSDCGRLSFASVQEFCLEHDLDLVVHRRAERTRYNSDGWQRRKALSL